MKKISLKPERESFKGLKNRIAYMQGYKDGKREVVEDVEKEVNRLYVDVAIGGMKHIEDGMKYGEFRERIIKFLRSLKDSK